MRVLGVVLGTVIVGLFFTVSTVVIAWVGKTNPRTVMGAALGAYLIKVVVLGVVLVMIPRDGPVNVKWMAGADRPRIVRLARRPHAVCLDDEDLLRRPGLRSLYHPMGRPGDRTCRPEPFRAICDALGRVRRERGVADSVQDAMKMLPEVSLLPRELTRGGPS